MIGGLFVGVLSVFLLAYLTRTLIKTYNNQGLIESSRGFRAFLIGVGYVVQFALLVYLSTAGGAYRWLRSGAAPASADTSYVIGLVVGIFVSSGLIFWISNRGKK